MDQELLLSLNQISKDVKKEHKSLRNRIQSILLDNDFLKDKIMTMFPNFPLIPNERCGLWYCNPSCYTKTSYFKSTDGHMNMWDFSTRRLNFHLLPLIEKHNGIVIVDSTRRGKTMPDALSKTVPIWCAVLNTLMMESQALQDDRQVLFLPPGILSQSERDQILKRVPSLVEKLKTINVVDGNKLCEQFKGCLLRPFWIYPGSPLLNASRDPFTGEILQYTWETPKDEKIIPIVLCTASYKAQDGVDTRHGFTYVQGAADDHELWSDGLTPQILWENVETLGDLGKSDEALQVIVQDLVSQERKNLNKSNISEIFPNLDRITDELSLGKIMDGLELNKHIVQKIVARNSLTIILSKNLTFSDEEGCLKAAHGTIKVYPLQSGCKRSSKELRMQLPEIYTLILAALNSPLVRKKPILIACNSGTDMSVAILLVTLCKNYRLNWSLGEPDPINKITIRKHLTKLITSLEGRNVNPSRATLNSVNSYLM